MPQMKTRPVYVEAYEMEDGRVAIVKNGKTTYSDRDRFLADFVPLSKKGASWDLYREIADKQTGNA